MPIPSMYMVYYTYMNGCFLWYSNMVHEGKDIIPMDCVWDDNAINACSHPESQTGSTWMCLIGVKFVICTSLEH